MTLEEGKWYERDTQEATNNIYCHIIKDDYALVGIFRPSGRFIDNTLLGIERVDSIEIDCNLDKRKSNIAAIYNVFGKRFWSK